MQMSSLWKKKMEFPKSCCLAGTWTGAPSSIETVRSLTNPSSSRIFSTQRKIALCVSSQYKRRVREIVESGEALALSAVRNRRRGFGYSGEPFNPPHV